MPKKSNQIFQTSPTRKKEFDCCNTLEVTNPVLHQKGIGCFLILVVGLDIVVNWKQFA
jgi:hypothetical protein